MNLVSVTEHISCHLYSLQSYIRKTDPDKICLIAITGLENTLLKSGTLTSPLDAGTATAVTGERRMTREELERHLEIKSSAHAQFMAMEKTSHVLPDNIFNDNSNSW